MHDVAPGASLAFYTAENSEADFAAGIGKLAAAGAKIIADDVSYFDEPFFQDGIVAQAIDAVEAPAAAGTQPVAYFSAAGNDGNASYENTAPSFATLSSSGSNSGEYLLNFDTTGATTATSLPITLDAMQPGEFTAIVVEWDQPYMTGAPNSGGATSRIDICVTGSTGVHLRRGLRWQHGDLHRRQRRRRRSRANSHHQPNPAGLRNTRETLDLVIGLADGTAAPGRLKVAVETDGQEDPPITQFATNSATLQGHPGRRGCTSAAVRRCILLPDPRLRHESGGPRVAYSSEGGAPILFDVTRAALGSYPTR